MRHGHEDQGAKPQASETPVQVRSMSAADAGDYAELFKNTFCAPPWNESWDGVAVQQQIEKQLSKLNFIGLVAKLSQGRAVGYLSGFVWRRLALFYLDQLFVDTRHRNLGIGRTLVSALLERLRVKRIRTVFLLTQPQSPAERFYRSLGFGRFWPWAWFNKKVLLVRRFQ